MFNLKFLWVHEHFQKFVAWVKSIVADLVRFRTEAWEVEVTSKLAPINSNNKTNMLVHR
jgi:hypothetical protein